MKILPLIILAGTGFAQAGALPANINQLDPQVQQAIYNANGEIRRQTQKLEELREECEDEFEPLPEYEPWNDPRYSPEAREALRFLFGN